MIQTLEPLLAEHPFFKGLEEPFLKLAVGCAANVRFHAGQYIVREGEEADQFFVIRTGRVNLETPAPGRGALTLQTLSAGDILGWSWVFPPYQWPSDARAVEDTRAIALDGACLRRKCEEDPRLGYELMKRFARVLDESLRAARLQMLDVYGRERS